MNRDAFFVQLGKLVRMHNHGVAFTRLDNSAQNLSSDDKIIGQALLLLSSGYTRSVIRSWIISDNLQIDEMSKTEICNGPVTSPIILFSGLELIVKNYGKECSVLSHPCFNDLIAAAYITSLVFDEMERNSKQQSISTLPVLVREIAPACLAVLPLIEKDCYLSYQKLRSVDCLRLEGNQILSKLLDIGEKVDL